MNQPWTDAIAAEVGRLTVGSHVQVPALDPDDLVRSMREAIADIGENADQNIRLIMGDYLRTAVMIDAQFALGKHLRAVTDDDL